MQGSIRAFEGALAASAGRAPVADEAGLDLVGTAIVEHAQLLHSTLAERNSLATALKSMGNDYDATLALVSSLNAQLEDVTNERNKLATTIRSERTKQDATLASKRTEYDASVALVASLNEELDCVTTELQLRARALAAACKAEAELSPLLGELAAVMPKSGSYTRQGWSVDVIRLMARVGEQRVEGRSRRIEQLAGEHASLTARNLDPIRKLRAGSGAEELEPWRLAVIGALSGLLSALAGETES